MSSNDLKTSKSHWSEEEDWILFEALKRVGKDFDRITSDLPGRCVVL